MMQTDITDKGIQFISLAPTNKACRVINGTTLHKFTISHSHEISMVSEHFDKFFITLHRVRPEIKFIICGDFAQLLPVNDRIENLEYRPWVIPRPETRDPRPETRAEI